MPDPGFMIAASRDLADWDAVLRLPLAAFVDCDELHRETPVDFVPQTGRFGRWNVDGHVLKLRNLPKVAKFYAWESRNFGRSDTSTRFRTRMVYQSELIHGRGMHLSVQATPKIGGNGYVVFVRCEFLFDRDSGVDEHDVVMASSLVEEALEATPHALPPTLTRDEWEKSLRIEWSRVLLADYAADRIYTVAFDGQWRPADTPAREVALERITMIQSTLPTEMLIGKSANERYICFKYRGDLVALENLSYGNALYVMYDDWETLALKTRMELLSGNMIGFDRVVHTGKWRDKFRNLLTAHKHDSVTPIDPIP